MSEPTLIINSFDRRVWRFNIVIMICYCALLLSLIVVFDRIIVTIIAGLSIILVFYIVIIGDLLITPNYVKIVSEGVQMTFLIGKSILLKWDDLEGWKQIKSLRMNVYTGIWLKNGNVYLFNNVATRAIKEQYLKVHGVPLNEIQGNG